jgi:mitochondrial fission protein ELM1
MKTGNMQPTDIVSGRRLLVIWVILDGNAGHENQSMGLADALARITPVSVHSIAALSFREALAAWVFGHADTRSLPTPDLLLATGVRTHPTLLALARHTRGRTVVLMSPTLPRRWFDLCIVPEHDGIEASPRILITLGALNRVQPALRSDSALGLIMIGGPSSDYRWDTQALTQQIAALVARTPGIDWTLTDSRRTPPEFLPSLQPCPNLRLTSHQDTPRSWLPEQLQRSANVWVTPDSVSMLSEALTAGAKVGVFDLDRYARSRFARAVEKLKQEGYLTTFRDWSETGCLRAPPTVLAEADRCAAWVLEWLNRKT